MITLNGSVKFRNRQIPIFRAGEFAQHLAEKNIKDPKRHPYLHVQAQKSLQACTVFKRSGKSHIGITIKDSKEIYVVFFTQSKFAMIKTCYIYGN